MTKLTLGSVGKVLSKAQRRKLFLLSVARLFANLLDLAGLAGIGLLAASFGGLASGTGERTPITLPLIGDVLLSEQQAVLLAFGIAVTFLVKSAFSIWLNLISAFAVADLEGQFSNELAVDYFRAGGSTFSANDSVSEFQNKVMYSTGALTGFLNARLTLLAEGSLAIAMILIFFLVNPFAALGMLIFMLVVLAAMNRLITFRVRRSGDLAMKGSQLSLEASRDLFGVKKEASAAGSLSIWIGKFTSGKRQTAQATALVYTLNSLPRYIIETALILGIFIFLGGVVIFSDLATQAVTIGVFLAGGLRLAATLLPLQTAYTTIVDTSNRGRFAFEAVLQARAESPASNCDQVLEPREPSLKLEDISFSYPDSSEETIHSISFSVNAFSKVALVGPSGAGKTTLFDLATGFLLPQSGHALIGGLPARDVMRCHPGFIGIVNQRPHLVHGSLVENVTLDQLLSSSLERVKESLQMAGLSHYTSSPDWHLLQIKPDSGQFSGGEIQRIGLARALYRNPKILFLDEATSALDAKTEDDITKVLYELKQTMTVVLIAHRLSTVKNADKILYVSEGRLVAEGTFPELVEQVPEFSNAVKMMDLSA